MAKFEVHANYTQITQKKLINLKSSLEKGKIITYYPLPITCYLLRRF
jgi:hypothetical protein